MRQAAANAQARSAGRLNLGTPDTRRLLRARPARGRVALANIDPADTHGISDKKATAGSLKYAAELLVLQERLYAESKRSVLIVLQGLDTSGKDGTIGHVMTGMNPEGVNVHSFKKPTALERRHHFLWRIKRELPSPGYITIFNRSHYEDVLIARVHHLASPAVIERRYGEINRFEASLARHGTTVVKFFLHISKREQRRRLLERLDTPDKHWKFNPNDLKERGLWGDYQEAFAIAIGRCSTAAAPWYVIPADDKIYRNWAVSRILLETLRKMDPKVPMPALDIKALKRELKRTD